MGTNLTGWHFAFSWDLAVALGIGAIIAIWVAMRPRVFWPASIAISVVTAGLVIQGYGIVDDYLVGCVILGGLIAMSVRPALWARKEGSSLHRRMFILLMGYLVFQSIRGALVLEDWKILRFALFFAMLALLTFLGRNVVFRLPSSRKVAWIITLSALVYFSAYLIYGLYSEMVRGIDRFERQSMELWGGSVYVMFPLVLLIPCGIFLMGDSNRIRRWIGLIALSMAAIDGGYYDSRISLISMSAFFLVAMFSFRLPRLIIAVPVIFVFLLLGLMTIHERPMNFILSFGGGLKGGYIYQTGEPVSLHDLDRLLATLGAIHAVSGDLTRLIFGHGFWVHRLTLTVPFEEVFNRYVTWRAPDVVRTTGFAAFLTDTGMIGILLLFMNFLLTVHEITTKTRQGLQKNRIILIAVPLLVVLWIFVNNIWDIVLLYLLIMPGGLLAQLSRYGEEEQRIAGTLPGHAGGTAPVR